MNEEYLLDLTQMPWITEDLQCHWQTLDACITEGEAIEASTVLNILSGTLNAVAHSSCGIERLILEPEDADLLGRTMDCLTRLYLSYHRQYIREQDESVCTDAQQFLQDKAEEADLYSEFLTCLKSIPDLYKLKKMKAELQQLTTALEGAQQENARLLKLNPSDNVTALKERITVLEKELAAAQQASAPIEDSDTVARLNEQIKALEKQLADLQTEMQTVAALAAERNKKLTERNKQLKEALAAAQQENAAAIPIPAADPVPVQNPDPNPQPIDPLPDLPDEADVFVLSVVNNGLCSITSCDGKTKIGAPSPEIRDQIVELNLSNLLDPEIQILDGAFRGCPNLKKVSMPYSRPTIGIESFADCPNLEEVCLEYTASIGNRAFRNCPSLQKVQFRSRRTEISEDAFDFCPQVAFDCRRSPAASDYAARHGINTL